MNLPLNYHPQHQHNRLLASLPQLSIALDTQPEVASAEISLVLHATEDEEKVISSLNALLEISRVLIIQSATHGHFGNSIKTLKVTVRGRKSNELLDRIVRLLSSSDRATLVESIEDYVDEKRNLYLRLDKQALCKNAVRIAEQDPIRIRLRPGHRTFSSDPAELYRRILSSIE